MAAECRDPLTKALGAQCDGLQMVPVAATMQA